MTTAPLPRGRRRLLVSLLMLPVLVSCGGTDLGRDISAGHDVVVVGLPATSDDRTTANEGAPAGPAASRSTAPSRDDLVHETRLTPDDVYVDSADRSLLRVRFTTGPAPCVGVRLAVDEGPASVRVVLYVGTPPDSEGVMCPAAATTQEVRWELDRPIGSRELIWSQV